MLVGDHHQRLAGLEVLQQRAGRGLAVRDERHVFAGERPDQLVDLAVQFRSQYSFTEKENRADLAVSASNQNSVNSNFLKELIHMM